jgi:HK97 family phage major capsid protein
MKKFKRAKAGPWSPSDDVMSSLATMSAALESGTDADVKAALRKTQDALHAVRTESKAGSLGKGSPISSDGGPDFTTRDDHKPAKQLRKMYGKARLDDAPAGTFIRAIWQSRSSDFEAQQWAKAALRGFGVERADLPTVSAGYLRDAETAKATLGATGATGGYVLPNNLVDSVVKPRTAQAHYEALVTVRPNVNVRGVDQPYRTGAPTRMTFSDWGSTKENLDEAYGSYTATLGTMARIYDVGKQYLRFSAGLAEQDVMDELAKARILGENYYIIAGAGTGALTPGVNDPTEGVYTALLAGAATYTTAFAGASASTIAGSAAAGIGAGLKAMVARSQIPSACVVSAVTYFSILTEGSDNAGFFIGSTPMAGGAGLSNSAMAAGFRPLENGGVAIFGVPLLWDEGFDTNTGTTKAGILADWSQFRLYRGSEFRIDTSDQAGSRWDRNEVGFRGEQEIGFHAGTGVSVGAAQLITGLIP